MTALTLFQTFLNLCFLAGLFILFRKAYLKPKDDPRLSRGLQLLQSKIAILEDLSDRVDQQARSSSTLIDQKIKEIQKQMNDLANEMSKIEVSRQKSLEVAQIFQDKIPHQEIIERKNTIKYVQAARMAHQGLSIDEIASKIDLPLGELEFIIKINRKELQFSEAALPAWAQENDKANAPAPVPNVSDAAATTPMMAQDRMKDLGQQFRAALHQETIVEKAAALTPAPMPTSSSNGIQKVVFPRI